MAARVQKLLAEAGIGSRRACEELIRQGRVAVNGNAIALGATALPSDSITLDGKPITLEKKIYVLLHKPKGVVSTTTDPYERRTVLDLVPMGERLYPVGRLDIDAEGLMLLTNDGAYANRMMHPRYEVQKTYEAWLHKRIAKEDVRRLRGGLRIDERMVRVDQALVVKPTVVQITLHEGQKHIVKKIFKKLGYGVKRLVRTQLGPWKLAGLQPGKWRLVSP